MEWLAQGTLNKGKISDGMEAINWWRNGEIEKLKEYCLKDVEITKDLFEYAKENKTLKYKDLGTMHEIPIDITNWVTESVVEKNGLLKF